MPGYVITRRSGRRVVGEPEVFDTRPELPSMPQLLHLVRDLIEDLADQAAFSMTAGPRGLSEQDAERATQPWEKLLDEVNDDQERAADLCESDGLRYDLPDGTVLLATPTWTSHSATF
jgi:hypothetical protein